MPTPDSGLDRGDAPVQKSNTDTLGPTKSCSCGGLNENCSRCGGLGEYRPVLASRSAAASMEPSPYTESTRARRRKDPPPRRPAKRRATNPSAPATLKRKKKRRRPAANGAGPPARRIGHVYGQSVTWSIAECPECGAQFEAEYSLAAKRLARHMAAAHQPQTPRTRPGDGSATAAWGRTAATPAVVGAPAKRRKKESALETSAAWFPCPVCGKLIRSPLMPTHLHSEHGDASTRGPSKPPADDRAAVRRSQNGFTKCPVCNCELKQPRRARHLEKVHAGHKRGGDKPIPSAARKSSRVESARVKSCGPTKHPGSHHAAATPRTRGTAKATQTIAEEMTDRRDASLGIGYPVRERGRYGSFPGHDGFDDESGPT